MKKALALAVLLAGTTVVPANAALEINPNPKLTGYICIDSKGIHRSWTAAFDGQTYCKLVPNPAVAKLKARKLGG